MKAANSYRIKQNKAIRTRGSGRRLLGKAFCVLISMAAIGLGWRSLLSSPDAHLAREKLPDIVFEYPDRFSMRAEYLERFAVRRHVIRQGETIHGVLEKFKIPLDCVYEWQNACADSCRLDEIYPGDELTVRINLQDQTPVKFIYAPANGNTLIFRRVGEGWRCHEERAATYTLVESIRGTITGNLYDSSIQAGVPAHLILDLADLFAYDIDFNTDLRDGDMFAVQFQQEVREGKRIQSGPILAAEMVVSGKTFQAFFHESSAGRGDYFDADGDSLRKLFLKAPLSYRRISSTFTHRRFHPVLKIYRPHFGIDYAAPEGTPVSALGSGTVTFKGWKGGYGNFVEIRHNATYKTTYGHLSQFAGGLKKGSRVEQGQVIGYVGSTGVATGPHLDFRFYKNGTPIDFLKTEFPHAQSIPKSQLAQFHRTRDERLAALRNETGPASRKVVKTASNE